METWYSKKLIEEVLRSVGNLPTGGNEQLVEFSVLDDINETKKYKDSVYSEFIHKINQGIAPDRFEIPLMKEIISMQKQLCLYKFLRDRIVKNIISIFK